MSQQSDKNVNVLISYERIVGTEAASNTMIILAVIHDGRWIGLVIDFACMHYMCSDGSFPTDLWSAMTDYPQDGHGFSDASSKLSSMPMTNLHEGFAWARAVAFLEMVCLSDDWSNEDFIQRFENIVGDAPVLKVSLLSSSQPQPNLLPSPLSSISPLLSLTHCTRSFCSRLRRLRIPPQRNRPI